MRRTLLLPALVAALLLGVLAPAGAMAATDPVDAQTDNESVNVTTGAQLSTVLAVTSDDVRTDIEETAFEIEYEREDGRAEAVAERSEELRERAEGIREDYREAAEAYREGELTREEFAQRLATLNARAKNVRAAHDRLERRAANVSAFDLRAAGANTTALRRAVASLENVSGTGTSALLAQFTGEREGEIELETEGGLSIEVRSEDGERSREFEREPDADTAITVTQSAALATARGNLTGVENGSWALRKAGLDGEDGVYSFEFALRAPNLTGEAEVDVDASSGAVVALEEEIKRTEDEEREEDEREDGDAETDGERDDDERDDDGEELALVVTDGQPAPNATVTLRALAGGEPASNVTVSVDGEAVGETDANGTITLTLPDAGEVELTAERGEGEAELEFEFGDREEREDEAFDRNLDVSASLDNGTVTVTATYEGSGIANATVYADGERVGTTDADGTASFDIDPAAEDLELKLVKGEFEAEYEFAVEDGSLTMTDGDYENEEREEDEEAEDAGEEERDGDEDGEDAQEETVDELDVTVDEGDPAPGATVTLQVFAGGEPADNATVSVNDERVGTTDSDGRLTVTLPDADGVEITAERGDADGELEFEFGDTETETETEDDGAESDDSDEEDTETETEDDDSDDDDD